MQLFGRKRKKYDDMSEEEKRKKRKKTLRQAKRRGLRYGEEDSKKAYMDEIADTGQHRRPRRNR